MAKLNDGFDAYADENQLKRKLAEPGSYDLIVIDTKLKENSKGTGNFIAATLEIVTEGPAKGTRFFENYNWENPSDTAKNIGRAQWALICRAVNRPVINDSDEVKNIPFVAPVIIQEGTGGYSDSNTINYNELRKQLDGKSEVPKIDKNDDIPSEFTSGSKKSEEAPWKS